MKHYSMPPAATKSKKAIFSFKVEVKVTRSLTLVSFKRASLVEYACQIWSLYLLQFKSYSELKLTTDKQTDKQTDRQDKNNMPPIIRSGGIKRKSVGLLSSNLPCVIDRSYLSPSRKLSNIPGFLSVDLIGENNQVILEFYITDLHYSLEWAFFCL